MLVSCPGCHESAGIDPGPEGCLLRCQRCGTEWFARPYVANPYARNGFQGRMDEAGEGFGRDDERTIDHAAAGFEADIDDIEDIAPPRRFAWFTGPGAGLRMVAASLAVVAAVMVARVPIVAAFPERPEVAAARTERSDILKFQRVRSEHVDNRGGTSLVVEGQLYNPSWDTLSLPALEVVLVSVEGMEVRRWRVDLAAAEIGGRQTIGFRTALVSPPASASEVKLTFAPRLGRPAGKS